MITITPPPGNYEGDTVVTIDGPEGYQVLVSINGPDPVLVRTVASFNSGGVERPYIQYMDDGRGRVILDGAFTKYYGTQASTDPGKYANAFLKNCIDYISPVENPRILFLGDKPLHPDYSQSYTIKGPFKLFFETFCTLFDFVFDIKDADDFGGELDFGFQDLTNYDVIFFLGSKVPSETWATDISDRAATAIALFREEGRGLYLCTDHDVYTTNCNRVLSKITEASFEGSYNFSPGTTVEYNRNLHGDSPLFKGLSDDTAMRASTSDSNVVQDIPESQSLPLQVVVGPGHNSFKLGIINPDGEMSFEHYYYGINESPVIQVSTREGDTISQWPETNLRQRRIYFKYNNIGQGNCSGYVRAGNTIIGIITDCPPGPLDVEWLNTEYTISALGELVTMTGDKNLNISVELTEPFEYNMSWSFNRFIPQMTETLPEYFNQLNRNEFYTPEPSVAKLFRKAADMIYNPSVGTAITPAEYINQINHALTVEMPNMLYTPSSQDIFNTFDKYVVGSGANPDADFTLRAGVLTNVRNAGGNCMLVNPDTYHAYQSVILSSTNRDDDGIGLVFASRETETDFYLAAVEVRLDQPNYPRIRLRRFQMAKPFEVGTPGIEVINGIPVVASTTIELVAMKEYQTRNADGFDGWLSPGWKDGVHISVEYLDETLTVRMNPPGERPSDNYQYVYTGTSQNIRQLLRDMKGASGLYVQSQASSYWSNYAIIRLDD